MSSVRHKCFISYHKTDADEVDAFIKKFSVDNQVFIKRIVSEMEDNIVQSTDNNYVMRRIRELYLSDSTVTIVLIGSGTWGRKYVDWEIMSSLRNDPINKRSGLLAIQLPCVDGTTPTLPARLEDNLKKDSNNECYACYYRYPSSAADLTSMIEEAFQARSSRAHLVDNTRAKRERNSN